MFPISLGGTYFCRKNVKKWILYNAGHKMRLLVKKIYALMIVRGWNTYENLNSQPIFLEEFLSDRAENLYTHSLKGLEGRRASHFPKISENFPEICHLRKSLSFIKFLFSFFFFGFQ